MALAAAAALVLAGVAAAADAGAPRAAGSADGGAAFDAAKARAARGDAAGAVAELEALAASLPAGDLFVDEALVEAAQLREDVLADPAGALALYRRVLSEYPDGRPAKKAARRIPVLERGLGAGEVWAAQLAELSAVKRLPVAQTMEGVARVQALLAAHPDMPDAGDARLWLAGAWLREGRYDEALADFRRAMALPDDDLAWQGRRGEAEVLLVTGDLDGAEAGFAAMRAAAGDDAARLREAAKGLRDVDELRARRRNGWFAWAAIALFALYALATLRAGAASWRAAARKLARPPVEVLYIAPVALVVVAASWTSNELVARAVTRILAGGLAAAWLSGAASAAWAGRRRGAVRLAVHLVALAAAIGAICYLAVTRDQLIELLHETWAHGHDR